MTHAVCVLTKFCSWNPKCKGKFLRKKNVKKDKIRLHFFPWKDTRHTTHSLLLLLKNVFFCCSNCYSIRSLERDCFQERRHPQVVLFVCVLCLLIDHPREFCSFLSPLFVTRHFFHKRMRLRARAKPDDVFIPLAMKHHPPWKLLLFPPFVEKSE